MLVLLGYLLAERLLNCSMWIWSRGSIDCRTIHHHSFGHTNTHAACYVYEQCAAQLRARGF